jgi:hypothetical protein
MGEAASALGVQFDRDVALAHAKDVAMNIDQETLDRMSEDVPEKELAETITSNVDRLLMDDYQEKL